jgi:KDO2-lipid IV(A) lauroyltransferase
VKQFWFFLGIALLRVTAVLPYGWVARFGCLLGAFLYRIPSRRKRIVLVNLKLCFPTKTEEERDRLACLHFQQLIRSYLERGVQWFGSAAKIDRLTVLDSRVDLATVTERPTIFMGFHFVGIEAGCVYYSSKFPIASLYTQMSDKDMCALAKQQRGRFGAQMIERSVSAKDALRMLRRCMPVMLAADMDHGTRGSVFAPFFGVQACTLTSISRLAKMSNAQVIPFVTEVLPDFKGYKLTVFDPLSNYPSQDETADAATMNQFLETQISRLPDQYYWVHRRFKNRPVGEAFVY